MGRAKESGAMVPKSRRILELEEGFVGSARVGRQGLEPDGAVVDFAHHQVARLQYC